MSAAEWIAGGAGLAAIGTLIFSIWTRVSASMSNVQQVFGSQQQFMQLLQNENADLRQRQTNHGEQMARIQERYEVLRQDRDKCERDKLEMQSQISLLNNEVQRLKERLNGHT